MSAHLSFLFVPDAKRLEWLIIMIIALEGMDGSGKTETAMQIADILHFEYVNKPMKMMFDKSQEGITSRILESLNAIEDRDFWALLLGAAQYYQSMVIKGRNIILDRHLTSNYYHNVNENNGELFDYLVKICEKPDLTVVLYVTPPERKRRIINREGTSGDLIRFEDNDLSYSQIRSFLEKHNMNYLWLDTTEMPKNQVVQRIIEEINVL